MVRLMATRAGADVVDHGVVADDRDATRAAILEGLAGDVLVVSGGVSVGPHDHVKPAFLDCGVERCSGASRSSPASRSGSAAAAPPWSSACPATRSRPSSASPSSSSRRCGGWPASTARPRLEAGRLTAPAEASDGRTTFLTAALREGADGVLEATPTERQGSHMTGALGESDGFAVAPDGLGELRPERRSTCCASAEPSGERERRAVLGLGRGPRMRRSPSSMATSLMLASRRRM